MSICLLSTSSALWESRLPTLFEVEGLWLLKALDLNDLLSILSLVLLLSLFNKVYILVLLLLPEAPSAYIGL